MDVKRTNSSVSPRGGGSAGGNAASGSPKTPFMERMKQSLGGSSGDGGKSSGGGNPASPSGSPANSNILPRTSTAGVLRRKDRDSRSALSFAARAFTEVVDTVEQAAKKVSLGSIATAVANIARDKKISAQATQLPGPLGVTQACSVIFQHVLSPLWALESNKPMTVPTTYVSFQSAECVRLMRQMEAMSAQQAAAASATALASLPNATRLMLEALRPMLESSVDLSTAFMVFLCAKLRWVESQDTLPILDVWSPGGKGGDASGGGGKDNKGGEQQQHSTSAVNGPTFEQLILGLREEYLRRDDEIRFEDRINDESQTADHPRRRLEEIGGRQWRPKGANMLSQEAHEYRHHLLHTIMYASVTLTYNYYDPLLQFVVDEICCKQLFLTSFSEGFSQLVAGIKGPKYLAKYISFVCRDTGRGAGEGSSASGGAVGSAVPGGTAGESSGASGGLAATGGGTGTMSSDRTSHFSLATVGVESVILQDVLRSTELALQNFTHRNDVSSVLFRAFHIAICNSLTTDCDRTSATALFFRINCALQVSYVADLEVLVALVDVVKPLVAKPNPIGSAAFQLLRSLFASLRDVNVMQRQTLNRLFVGGPAHSFRRVPAYAVISPYCARSSLISQIYWGDVDQRRAGNPKNPAVLSHGKDPHNGDAYPQLDDTTVCIANHLINIFQVLHELEVFGDNDAEGDDEMNGYHRPQHQPNSTSKLRIDLRLLFSINPTTLASIFPSVLNALEKVQNETGGTSAEGVLKPTDMDPEVLRTLQEMYLMIQDRHRPASGAVRFRNESPRLPVVPLRVHKFFDKDELEGILKSMMDDYSTSCDARIHDRDVAHLHPDNHISLRMFVDSTMKVLVGGGSGLLRRAVSASLRLQQNYPGAYVRPLFFVLPLGYGNDMSSWLARGDSVYRERIFNLFMSQPVKLVDPPTPEQWGSSLLLTPAAFSNMAASTSSATAQTSSTASGGNPSSASASSPPLTDNVTSLLFRDAINDFVTFATQTNEIVIYQAECTFVDTNFGTCYLPFVSNFEVGSHVNTAVQTAYRSGNTLGGQLSSNGVLQPNPSLHTASFSLLGEKLRNSRSSAGLLSRQGTNQSNSSGESNPNIRASSSAFLNSPNNNVSQSMLPSFGTAPSSAAGAQSLFVSQFSINIGDRSESLDRVLTRMHGQRGIALTTKKHLLDGTELPHTVSGDNVLDWISTTYHLYDLGIARTVAQSLLDSKLLVTMCVPLGKEPSRFQDTGIYAALPREELDAQPLCPPSVRSVLCEHSNWNRIEFEDQMCNASGGGGGGGGAWSSSQGGGASGNMASPGGAGSGSAAASGGGGGGSGGGPAMVPIRVTFQSYFDGALQYNDLVDFKDQTAHRDIVSLKIKSAGAAEDLGPLPNPCTPTLVMTLLQGDGRKKGGGGTSSSSSGGKQRDICDMVDHYQIKFGDRQWIDPRSTLQLEWKAPPATNAPADPLAFGPIGPVSPSSFGNMPPDSVASFGGPRSGVGTVRPDALGMYCMCDGDVFGPFSFIRIKPVATKIVQQGDGPIPPRSTFATAAIMSFVKPM